MIVAIGRVDEERIRVNVAYTLIAIFNTTVPSLELKKVGFAIIKENAIAYIRFGLGVCRNTVFIIHERQISDGWRTASDKYTRDAVSYHKIFQDTVWSFGAIE